MLTHPFFSTVRSRVGQVHRSGRLRCLWEQAVSSFVSREVFPAPRQGLQVLPRFRKLKLQGLHHGEILCQRTRKYHLTQITFALLMQTTADATVDATAKKFCTTLECEC
ncbi:hypothetical protein J437_LFUL004983 [Ladona fulva]|uniref:Uncharacterized protein n=1 Tax=Ladona fulva TaxID=123851 RepID=A0A8K0JY89_LADFU|nr:hypothetical protein J437_LFUL004983 [Ladona fulva]